MRAATGGGVRVLLAEDSGSTAGLLEAVLRSDPRLTVVGRARTGTRVLWLAERHRPDVVVIDASPSGTMATWTASQIASLLPSARIVVFTSHPESVSPANGTPGAHAIVARWQPLDALIDAILNRRAGDTGVSANARG